MDGRKSAKILGKMPPKRDNRTYRVGEPSGVQRPWNGEAGSSCTVPAREHRPAPC